MRKLTFLLASLGLCLMLAAFSRVSLASAPSGCSQQCVYLPQIGKLPEVKVTGWSVTDPGDGSFEIYGELLNATSSAVYSVTLEALYYDRDGELFGRHTLMSELPVLFPGQAGPFFGIEHYPGKHRIARVKVLVTGYSVSSTSEYQQVTVLSKHLSGHQGESETFWGEIRNDSSQTLQSVKVVVWSMHPDGDIRPAVAELGQTTLAPGETTTYTARVFVYTYYPPYLSEVDVVGLGEVVR